MIFFITRSIFPFHPAGGGIARYLQVRDLLRAGEQVTIVLPWDARTDDVAIGERVFGASVEIIRAKSPVSVDVGRALQALGIFDDYLSGWAHAVRTEVSKRMSATDTIVATSGGELATLQLGVMLKSTVGCRLIYHLHDPPDHVDIDGLRVPSRYPHRNRKSAFARLLNYADRVYTTNASYANHLATRYNLKTKVSCSYIFDRDLLSLDDRMKLPRVPNFVYGGNMSPVQRPELFYPGWIVARESVPLKLTFVGSTQEVASRGAVLDGATCLPTMERIAFLNYVKQEVDVGLVSLFNPYHSYCTPSKLFDFILLGVPVLVIGADGDLVDLVTEHGLGTASSPGDVRALAENMIRLSDASERDRMRQNVVRYAKALACSPLYPSEL